jgi:hypothetical protein
MSEEAHDIDVVAIGRAYIGVSDVGEEVLETVMGFVKKKVPPERIITGIGRVLLTVMTQEHLLVEDFFADMTNEQARMIKIHNRLSPECDAFRRFY